MKILSNLYKTKLTLSIYDELKQGRKISVEDLGRKRAPSCQERRSRIFDQQCSISRQI